MFAHSSVVHGLATHSEPSDLQDCLHAALCLVPNSATLAILDAILGSRLASHSAIEGIGRMTIVSQKFTFHWGRAMRVATVSFGSLGGARRPKTAIRRFYRFGPPGRAVLSFTKLIASARSASFRRSGPRRVGALVLAACFVAALLPAANAETASVHVGPIVGGKAPAVLGIGGGVWRIPRVQEEIAPILLDAPRLGVIRAALAWEVLAPSTDLKDLDRRLDRYRLNEFLVDASRRGATIIVSLDAMPRWLAADKSDRLLADGPALFGIG